ncbi:MAG: putative porin [Sphingomonas sp.]|jgi:hypothetical protein|uniref:putative porin n=1 Tax=Sphingomonas sp. TaxID=28214 RepID=UPI0035642D14
MFARKLALLTGASLLTVLPTAAQAQASDDIGVEILQLLVDEGIVPAAKAQDLLARAKSAAELRKQREAPSTSQTIDVGYVPQTVRDEIKEEVRKELTEDAKKQRWIAPDILPGWLDRISLSGDFRLRHQSEFYADGNFNQFPDINAINAAGGVNNTSFPLLNSTVDRKRIQYRARIGVDAQLSKHVRVGFRVASGDDNGPVSTDATFGDYFRKDGLYIDRAFISVKPVDQLELTGGRMPNPFVSTDLVWDQDINPEGVALSAHYDFGDDLMGLTVFGTGGAFPLQERGGGKANRWLYAGQAGFSVAPADDVAIKLAGAYYDFQNVQGEKDKPASRANDFTAPPFLAKGNSIFNIRNDGLTSLAGLASRFELLDVTGSLSYTGFGPIRVALTGDYVRNLGYNRAEIAARRIGEPGSVPSGNTGFQARLDVGHPDLTKFGDWQVSAAYKRIETDAVLDIFTDNDFGFGGTDVEGYILRGSLGVYKNTALGFSWYSTKSIERAPFDIDVLQLDLTAKF